MRISFERTGGFAGISKTTSVDTETMKANEVKQLLQLLETANFFQLPANITSPSPGCDSFEYTLTVEDNGHQHTVTVSESALPRSLKSLIEWVNNAS